MRTLQNFVLAAVAAASILCGSEGFAQSSPLIRTTQYGAIEGTLGAGQATYAWLGIPYAKPPVGARRWKAPVEPDAWPATLATQTPGNPCSQMSSIYGPPAPGQPWGRANADTFGAPIGSEDCLTLNIWRPASAMQNLPVIVFIHGGSNLVGYSNDPMYDGAALALGANAVVVTANYRLDVFGWMTHAALASGDAFDDSGNYGTLDLIRALQFVHDNVAAFGGDAGNVTLIGQSAGAIDMFSLIVSPLTVGLFQRGIAMSGYVSTNTPANGQQYTQGLLQRLLVQDGTAANTLAAQFYLAGKNAAWIKQFLYSKSATDLLRAGTIAGTSPPTVFSDGQVVPAYPFAAIAAGNFRNVPLIVGTTQEEGKGMVSTDAYKISDADRFRLMFDFDPDAPSTLSLADIVQPIYQPWLGPALYNVYAGLLTTAGKTLVQGTLGALAAKQARIYVYSFDWAGQRAPWNDVYGARHAMDLPFVFGNFGRNLFSACFGTANRGGREALSVAMMAGVAAFIRTDDPNDPALGAAWLSYPASLGVLHFDASQTQAAIRMQ